MDTKCKRCGKEYGEIYRNFCTFDYLNASAKIIFIQRLQLFIKKCSFSIKQMFKNSTLDVK